MNALAAATVAMTLGMPIDDVASGLSDVTSISPHRMAVSTVTKPETSFTLIDDSFNANPDSMRPDSMACRAGMPAPSSSRSE